MLGGEGRHTFLIFVRQSQEIINFDALKAGRTFLSARNYPTNDFMTS